MPRTDLSVETWNHQSTNLADLEQEVNADQRTVEEIISTLDEDEMAQLRMFLEYDFLPRWVRKH